MTDDRRDGIGQPHYGGPDDFAYERRAMQQRRPNLTGAQALIRLTEFRAEFPEDDEDD